MMKRRRVYVLAAGVSHARLGVVWNISDLSEAPYISERLAPGASRSDSPLPCLPNVYHFVDTIVFVRLDVAARTLHEGLRPQVKVICP